MEPESTILGTSARIPEISGHYLHYTSREGAQSISITRLIRPGRSGRIYLTKEIYAHGVDAANGLSIVNKPVELACFVDLNGVALEISPPSLVEPIRDDEGNILRHGGGAEFFVTDQITVARGKESWLALSPP